MTFITLIQLSVIFFIEKIDVVNHMHYFCLRELDIDLTFFPSLLWLSFLVFLFFFFEEGGIQELSIKAFDSCW